MQLNVLSAENSRTVEGRRLSRIEAEWYRPFLVLLLAHAADTAAFVAAEDSFGRTCVHLAALAMQPELLGLLDLGEAGGALLRKQDIMGRTALHLAAMTGRQDTMQALLQLAELAEPDGGQRLKSVRDVTGLSYLSLIPGRR